MFKIKQSRISRAFANMSNGMLGAVIGLTLVGGGIVGASTSNYWQNKISANESSITAAVAQSNNLNASVGENQFKIGELKKEQEEIAGMLVVLMLKDVNPEMETLYTELQKKVLEAYNDESED